MTTKKEKMIPLSVVDVAIEKLEIDNNYCYECGIDYQNFAREILEQIKKEAISFPIFSIMEPSLEQKILQRIKDLEDPKDFTDDYYVRIDELRKLLE